MANGQHRSVWVASFENGREDDDILTMGMESAAPVDTDLIFDAYDNDDFWLPTLGKPHTGKGTDNGLPGPGPEPFTAGYSMHGIGGIQGTQCCSSFWSSFGSQGYSLTFETQTARSKGNVPVPLPQAANRPFDAVATSREAMQAPAERSSVYDWHLDLRARRTDLTNSCRHQHVNELPPTHRGSYLSVPSMPTLPWCGSSLSWHPSLNATNNFGMRQSFAHSAPNNESLFCARVAAVNSLTFSPNKRRFVGSDNPESWSGDGAARVWSSLPSASSMPHDSDTTKARQLETLSNDELPDPDLIEQMQRVSPKRRKTRHVVKPPKRLKTDCEQQARQAKQSDSPAGQVVKPLTGYNFFFRYERDRLLKCMTAAAASAADNNTSPCLGPASAKGDDRYAEILHDTAAFQDRTLHDQWNRDPTVKRMHIKSHGCISFESLTKQISQGWRALPESVKQVFQDISTRDFARYAHEVKASNKEEH
jgi:hypothetical protein